MEKRINKKFSPTLVFGDAVIHATVEQLNLAIDSMLDKKKIKSLITTENEIDIAFKTNWIGMTNNVENMCSNLQLMIEPIDTSTVKLLYAFRLRNVKISKIYSVISAVFFALIGVIGFIVIQTAGVNMGASLIIPLIMFALAGLMLMIGFLAWSAKRQLKLFDKFYIKRLEKMLAIIQEEQ